MIDQAYLEMSACFQARRGIREGVEYVADRLRYALTGMMLSVTKLNLIAYKNEEERLDEHFSSAFATLSYECGVAERFANSEIDRYVSQLKGDIPGQWAFNLRKTIGRLHSCARVFCEAADESQRVAMSHNMGVECTLLAEFGDDVRHVAACSPELKTVSEWWAENGTDDDAEWFATHSEDFASVLWFGIEYQFTAAQAACVRALWKAWENGTPDLFAATILAEAEVTQDRLDHVFRDHPAWNNMIASSGKGRHRLAEPEQPPTE